MGSKKSEILEIIRNADEITQEVYEELVNNYDKRQVDLLIEQEMNEHELDKYDYYLDMKLGYLEYFYSSSYQIYLNEVKLCDKFTNDENKKYFRELSKVVDKINKIFDMYGYKNVMNSVNILKKIDLFLSLCDNKEDLEEIRTLSNEYVKIRDKIIVGNLGLVLSIAKGYCTYHGDRMEIVQNGNNGLIKAINKYDVNRDWKFTTYASYWIINDIIRGLGKKDTLFSVPVHVSTSNYTRIKTMDQLKDVLGREPTDIEVAKKMNIDIKKLESIKMPFEEVLSLEDVKEAEYEDVDSFGDSLIDYDTDLLKMYIDKEEGIKILNRIKKYLTEEEYLVLVKRYGLEGQEVGTYREIGAALGMSRAYASLIEKRALRKIREKCSDLSTYLH